VERLGILKIEDTLEDVLRATRLEVDQLYLLLEEKRETLAGTAENIRLAERAVAIASVRFEQGLATFLDFSESNLALNRARLNHFEALLQYRQAFADLQHVVGIDEIAGGAGTP
jgi:outer membrane protein TolC